MRTSTGEALRLPGRPCAALHTGHRAVGHLWMANGMLVSLANGQPRLDKSQLFPFCP
jgi:hypothetical protein